jgi:hypothetical protein
MEKDMKKVKSSVMVTQETAIAYAYCNDTEEEFILCLNALENEAEAAAMRIAKQAMARKAQELKRIMGKLS